MIIIELLDIQLWFLQLFEIVGYSCMVFFFLIVYNFVPF